MRIIIARTYEVGQELTTPERERDGDDDEDDGGGTALSPISPPPPRGPLGWEQLRQHFIKGKVGKDDSFLPVPCPPRHRLHATSSGTTLTGPGDRAAARMGERERVGRGLWGGRGLGIGEEEEGGEVGER